MKKCRRSIVWILVFIMTFAISVVSVDASTAEYMKIGLRYASSQTTAELESDSGFAIASVGNNAIISSGKVFMDEDKITLKLSSGRVEVTGASGTVLTTLTGDGTECITGGKYASQSDDKIKFSGKNYRGGIIPYINSSGQLNIINYLSVDDYVRGVVHSEIGQSSHIEAIKAQAVAIRSYAILNKSTHQSQGFDMCATTHCQVYSGSDSEYTSTNQAVDETKGELVYYEGKPVAAYYFANSGGHTENSEDAWSAALGYLRGIIDAYSPAYNWTTELTRADLNKTFSSKGLGTVESISIDSVNASGYAASITVKGSRDSITYTKENIRSALGVSLKSRNFTFSTKGGTMSNGGIVSQPTEETSYYGLSSIGTSRLGSSVSVLSAGGVSTKSLNGLTALDAGGNKAVLKTGGQSSVPSDSATTVTFNSDSDVLIINGKGYGHGVGMSQQGAQQMAKQGFTYKQILEYYYTGIEVK